MLSQDEIKIIKDTAEEFLTKMTFSVFNMDLNASQEKDSKTDKELVNLDIKVQDPKFLIGQSGQTLIELERVLRIILNKKLQKNFYLKLDINDYQKKKIEYLKVLAKDSADEVVLNKKEKALPPMSAYERRIIHIELEGRQDILTESSGDDINRHIIILPK